MIMVAVATMAAMSVNAQSNEPRNEISFSYGYGISTVGDGLGSTVGYGLFDGLIGRNSANVKRSGTFGVEYFRHLNNPKLAIGGIATFAQYSGDVMYNGVKESDRTRQYFTFMPAIKYYYINNNHFGLYSKAALGLTYMNASVKDAQTLKSNSDSKLFLAYQATLLGAEAGSKNFRGFIEAGVGEQGFVSAGIRIKF